MNTITNKRSISLLITSTLLSVWLQAQNLGVNAAGATPNASSIIDLNTGNTFTSPNGKGLLPPNVALTSITDAVTVTSPATSLWVYNTATASTGTAAVVPGYYYWDGAKWARLQTTTSSAPDWSLLGNAGTVAGTNFVGTTDAVDWVVKTNNLERMRVLSGGNVGIGTSTPSYKFNIYHTDPTNTIASYAQFNPTLSATLAANLHASWSAITPSSTFNITGTLYGAVNRITPGAGQSGAITGAVGSTNDVNHYGTGTINSAMGSINTVYNASTATIANAYGLQAQISNVGGGVITNGYGVLIQNVQATNKWSLYASDATAPTYFAANVGINNTAPATKLSIVATATNTGFQLQDGTQAGGNVLVSDATGKASWSDLGYPLATYYGTPPSTSVIINPSTEGIVFSGIIIPTTGFYLFNSNTPLNTAGIIPNSESYIYLCLTSAPYNAYAAGQLKYFMYNNETRISSNNVTEGICFLTAGSYDVRILNQSTNATITTQGHNFGLKSFIKL